MWNIPANPLWELLPGMTNSMAPLLFHRMRLWFAQDGVYSMPFLKTFSSVKNCGMFTYSQTKRNCDLRFYSIHRHWISCTINLLSLKCFGPEEKCLSLGFQTFQCDFWTATYRSISCMGRGRVMVMALIPWLPNTAPLVTEEGPLYLQRETKPSKLIFLHEQ